MEGVATAANVLHNLGVKPWSDRKLDLAARYLFATAILLLSFLAGCSAHRQHSSETAEDLAVLRAAVDSVMTKYPPSRSCDYFMVEKTLAPREEDEPCTVRLSRIGWSVDRRHALVYVEARIPRSGGTLIELERHEGRWLGKEWSSFQTMVVD